ncbi:MAG: hypothetical protein DWQ46_02605 [Planctomycetota bacterium]|nr:MAG: hypothetical protein DWQ46_02605 [Planctomycetota bacterium]
MATRDISYEYDAVGNRTKMTSVLGGATTTTTYTYDAANQLTSEINSFTGTTTYTYDDAGNLTEKDSPGGMTTYDYDARGLMVEADPGSPVTYTYNADGQRVRKETASETINYLYDFSRLLEQSDASHDPQTSYTSTEDEYGDLVSEYDQSGTPTSRYYTYDGLGSTDALVDPDGDVTDRYEYTAFGFRAHTQGSSETPFTFVGRQQYQRESEVDLYLLGGGNRAGGGRYYDPDVGRFLSKDRLEDDALANAYRYVGNNPINATDPSGESECIPRGELLKAGWAAAEKAYPASEQPNVIQPTVRLRDISDPAVWAQVFLGRRDLLAFVDVRVRLNRERASAWGEARHWIRQAEMARLEAECREERFRQALTIVGDSIKDRRFKYFRPGFYRLVPKGDRPGPWIAYEVGDEGQDVIINPRKLSDRRLENLVADAQRQPGGDLLDRPGKLGGLGNEDPLDLLLCLNPLDQPADVEFAIMDETTAKRFRGQAGLAELKRMSDLDREDDGFRISALLSFTDNKFKNDWKVFRLPDEEEFGRAVTMELAKLYGLEIEKPEDFWDSFLSVLSTTLGLLGILPGIGIFFDLAAVFVDWIRGDYAGVVLGLLAAIPIAGTFVRGADLMATGARAGARGARAASQATQVMATIAKRNLARLGQEVSDIPRRILNGEDDIGSLVNSVFRKAKANGQELTEAMIRQVETGKLTADRLRKLLRGAKPAQEAAAAARVAEAAGDAQRVARQAGEGAADVAGGSLPHLKGNIPDAAKWIQKGGRVIHHTDGSITYIKDGARVVYNPSGYPDFSRYLYNGNDGLNQVRIQLTGTRSGDFVAANRKAGFERKPRGYTWHHHENLGLMQLVRTRIHSEFWHSGGFSLGR